MCITRQPTLTFTSAMPFLEHDCDLKSPGRVFSPSSSVQRRRVSDLLIFPRCFPGSQNRSQERHAVLPRAVSSEMTRRFLSVSHLQFDKENRLGMFFKSSLYPDRDGASWGSSAGVSVPRQHRGVFQAGSADAVSL